METMSCPRCGTQMEERGVGHGRQLASRILFLIARQFNQILQVKELAEQGKEKNEIASRLKLQPFVVGKTISQSRVFSREQILSCVTLCVEMEEAVKTGRLQDRLAVELLITNDYRKMGRKDGK